MPSNFKILIVDDEVLIAEFLKDELKSLGYVQIEMAHNLSHWRIKMGEFNPDLVLLDIRMKNEKEGIEIAKEINEKHKVPFIFITAHSDKAILVEALATNPAGYITKPFNQIDVYAAINVVEKKVSINNEQSIVIKDGYAEVKIRLDEILYIQSDNNYIHIYTQTKKHTVRATLEWFKEKTPNKLFFQTHRSYIVNRNKITKTTSKSVFIESLEIPVSRGKQIKLD